VVFFADGNVKKAELDGSGVRVIGKTTPTRGMAWLGPDSWVLSNVQGPLLKMSGSGEVAPLLQTMGPQLPHLLPHILPGNNAVLFTMSNAQLRNSRIWVASLEKGEERLLFDENAFNPRYLPGGYIIFGQGYERRLMAVKFDLAKLEIVGSPVPILDIPLSGLGSGGSTDYGFSAAGALAYVARRDDSIDDVMAEIGNFNLVRIHVQLNGFDEVKRLVP
jgi:hypothetical protein